MSTLKREDRRLLVELAFCAVNHGLIQQAESIRLALSVLIADDAVRRRCDILLLIGLHRIDEAKVLLEQCTPQQAIEFHALLSNIID